MRRPSARVLSILLSVAITFTTFNADFSVIGTIASDEAVEVSEEVNLDAVNADAEIEEEVLEEIPEVEEVVEEATVEEVAEEPVEEPAVEEPAVEEPAVEEPAVEEPAADETTEEPAAQETTEEPATEEPAAEDVVENVVEAEDTAETTDENADSNLATVTYVAGEGGTVSSTSEVVDLNTEYTIAGSTATPNEGYEFVNWTMEEEVVCEEATITPSVVSGDITYTANFSIIEEEIEEVVEEAEEEEKEDEEEEEVKYPAAEFSGETSKISVSVIADEGAFPEGTTMVVTGISNSQAKAAAKEAMEEEVSDAVGVDISFRNADGEEIEPKDAQYVHVSLSLKQELEGDNFSVVHKDDNGNAETIAEASADGAEFDQNAFSIFIVVGTNDTTDQEMNAVATYTFYKYAESSVSNEVFNEQLIKTGDKLADPGIPSLTTGQEFIGWFYKDASNKEVKVTFGTELTVNETTEYSVYPKIRTTYYVTLIGGEGEVVQVKRKEVEDDGDTIVSLDDVTYIPKTAEQAFVGWTLDNTVDDPTIITSVDASKESERTVYAVVSEAHWIYFDENDDTYDSDNNLIATGGASYTGPVYVLQGETPSAKKPKDPTRAGYTFGGWYTGKGTAAGEVSGTEFEWDKKLTESVTLYAKWTINTETEYTVILWQQKVSDDKDITDTSKKSYDYKDSFTLTGIPGTKLSESDIAAYKTSCDDHFTYSWYEIVRLKDGVNVKTDEIRAAGDTVINIYFDRDLFTIQFNRPNGTSYRTYTGLYGQKLSKYNYSWPTYTSFWSTYGWYERDGSTRLTILDAFIFDDLLTETNDKTKLVLTAGGIDTGCELTFYLQSVDGSTYTAKDTVMISSDTTFNFTNKYTGFEVSQYRIGYYSSTGYTEWSDWSNASAGGSAEVGWWADYLEIRFTRNNYKIAFYDNFAGKTSKVTDADDSFNAIPYEQNLSSYETVAPDMPDKAGYTFVGWYEDQNGQKKFDWNSTMPSADKILYAYYQVVRYKVTLYPDGGTLPQGQIDKFNVSYGDTIERSSLEATTKSGYKLIGWFDKDTGLPYSYGQVTGEATTVDENGVYWGELNLIAKWRKPGTVSVVYNPDSYGTLTTQPDTYNYSTDSAAVVAGPPTSVTDGYAFIGWKLVGESTGKIYYPNNSFNVADGTIVYDDDDGDETKEPHGTVTLEAVYEKVGGKGSSTETTTLTYNANGGEGDDIVITTAGSDEHALRVNESVEVLDNSFTREGYEFIGWNTSADGTGLTVLPGQNYTIAADNNTINATNTDANILYAMWQKVYTVTWVNYDKSELEVDKNVSLGTTPSYDGETPTRPADAQYTYTFSGWDPEISPVTGDVTYTAQYTSEVNKYTVIWQNYDKEELEKDENVDYGTTPEYNGETPTKPADAQYTYTFSGWNPEISPVTGDVTYTAQYTSEVNKYTVIWQNYDKEELEKDENVDYGTTPEYNGETPTKPADAQYTYTFSGWNPEISPVTGDVTYTAQYTSEVNKYTVIWQNYDKEELEKDENVDYGTTPEYNGETPTKPATPQYTYTFSGWNPEISPVTGDVTYTAQYTSEVNKYTVIWQNYDKEELEKDENVDYGTTPEYNGETPTKPADAQYTYTFSGWNPEISPVTGDVTYTAQYTSEVNKYTVIWQNYDKEELEKDENVDYGTTPEYNGETPTKPATPQYTYTFSGWNPEISPVTGDVTYTAQYTSEVNKYTVIWQNYDKEELEKDENVDYGTTPEYNGETPTKPADAQYTYTFSGWNPEISPVTGDVTYTAQYTSEVNKYTVIWQNYDKEELEKDENVDYGTTPEYNGETPTKPADAQYTYTFSGWNPEISPVTGDVTYTAQYTSEVNKYTVIWQNYDKEELEKDENVDYGTTPEYNGETPTKPADAQYTYTFSGWNPEISPVTGDVTYTAQYTSEVNKYTVIWQNYDKEELEKDENVDYGTTPEYNGETPTKPATPQYTYTFSGWNPEISPVTGDVTYTAQYTSEVNKYTVIWQNYDKEELEKDENVDYGTTPEYNGETPTKPADAQYTYTFSGWDPEISPVTGDITYTAQYTETVNIYTVTFLNDDGSLISEEDYDYGTEASDIKVPADPTKSNPVDGYEYTFIGWDKEIVKVEGDATYTATYAGGKLTGTDATYVYDGNEYTVKFEFQEYRLNGDYTTVYSYEGNEFEELPKFTEVGEYPITATVTAYVGETETEITFEATATLTITAVPMTIIIDDKTMKYGETVPDFTWTVTSDSQGNTIPSTVLGAFKNFVLNATKTTDTVAVGANTYTVNMTPVVNDSPLNAGTYAITTAKDDIKILDSAGTEIATSNFVITVTDGTLTVDKRNVVLTSASASKQYDGTALTEGTVTTSEDGFAEGEGVAITVTGTQTEEGTSDNSFTYVLNDGTLAENYNITTVFGTLTVTAAPTDDTVTRDDDDDDDNDVVDADDDDDDDTTTTSNDNGPSDDGTTTITDAPTPLAATPQGAVLGANRDNTQTTDGAAVLGARRGGTSDSTNAYRIYILIVAAGIAVSLTILGVIARRKEEEE